MRYLTANGFRFLPNANTPTGRCRQSTYTLPGEYVGNVKSRWVCVHLATSPLDYLFGFFFDVLDVTWRLFSKVVTEITGFTTLGMVELPVLVLLVGVGHAKADGGLYRSVFRRSPGPSNASVGLAFCNFGITEPCMSTSTQIAFIDGCVPD